MLVEPTAQDRAAAVGTDRTGGVHTANSPFGPANVDAAILMQLDNKLRKANESQGRSRVEVPDVEFIRIRHDLVCIR